MRRSPELEAVNNRTSDADQDDFVRNRVLVLAEARVALPVWTPAAVCLVETLGAEIEIA